MNKRVSGKIKRMYGDSYEWESNHHVLYSKLTGYLASAGVPIGAYAASFVTPICDVSGHCVYMILGSSGSCHKQETRSWLDKTII